MHFTIGHTERLQHPVPKNSVPQMNTAKILSHFLATISSTQMLQSPQRAVLQQQRKLGRLVPRFQNVRMVLARIHESERVSCFSEKYQSVTIIQHVSESGDRMMRCCRANKASGLHLAKAASKEALRERASACTSASFRAHDVSDHCSLFARNARDTLARIDIS